jgi:hypothetical protein
VKTARLDGFEQKIPLAQKVGGLSQKVSASTPDRKKS